MGTELANGRECKMAALNTVDSTFKALQTKCFIVFINSKVVGVYKTKSKDFILFSTLII